jgi:soluble lytic murein transglycosylase-like protein
MYASGVGALQSQGLAKYAPATMPDETTLRMLSLQGTPSQTQAEWGFNLAANRAYSGATGTTPTGAGTTAAPAGASPLSIPARGTGGPGASASAPTEWLPYFEEASKETGIPVDLLIAQARQESSFDPNARGTAKDDNEIGLFQIKPSTARSPGFGVTGVDPATLTGPDNVRNNILFGARYLKARMGGGDPNNPAVQAAGLHAYNAGGDPNYVQHVFGYRPTLSPSDPNAAVTTYTPDGSTATAATTAAPGPTQYAGPGAPPRNALAPPPGPTAPYTVASNAPAPPPAPTTAAAPPAATPGQPPPAPALQPPAGGPAPPQLPALNERGLTPLQQRQINALAANPQTTLQQRMVAEQGFVNQNIQLAQKAFGDYVQLQQLEVQKGTLTNAQAETNLKYWQAAHPELAPNARVDTLAYRELQDLAPAMRGNPTQDQTDRYNNAAAKYQDFKEVTDPVTKQLKMVPTRPLPEGFPQPTGVGAGGGVRTLTEGLSPAQQQIERDPAAYKVSESQYDRDSKEIASIADAGRTAQADQIRINEMQDVLQRFSSGPGTEARTAASAWLQRWLPASITGWEKQSANLSGAEAAQAFAKLALAGAGSAERSVLGNRGGFQAIKMFQAANPNVDLQDATNKSILDMQLISNQANQDYSQAAQAHFAESERNFGGPTHQYKSLAQFDTGWNAQRNPQVYAGAMGAIGGQPASQWAKLLSDDEYARALQIVQRAKPSAIVQTKNGPYSMQPQAVTTGTSTAPGTKVIRYDHNGNVIQ